MGTGWSYVWVSSDPHILCICFSLPTAFLFARRTNVANQLLARDPLVRTVAVSKSSAGSGDLTVWLPRTTSD